jgi:hypothetical protein
LGKRGITAWRGQKMWVAVRQGMSGTATCLTFQAPDTDTARAILTPDRYAGIEVHNWQFGGRPS